jgi:hypothetical protein
MLHNYHPTAVPTQSSLNPQKATPKTNISRSPVVQDGPKLSYDKVLLALSDEYIGAAYNLGPKKADTSDEDQELLDMYHNLIAAGLSCLEATLKVIDFGLPNRLLLNWYIRTLHLLLVWRRR